jgi:hypothetical protein
LPNKAEKQQARDNTTAAERKEAMGEVTKVADMEEDRMIMALADSKVVTEVNNRVIMALDASRAVMVEEIFRKAASKSCFLGE